MLKKNTSILFLMAVSEKKTVEKKGMRLCTRGPDHAQEKSQGNESVAHVFCALVQKKQLGDFLWMFFLRVWIRLGNCMQSI